MSILVETNQSVREKQNPAPEPDSKAAERPPRQRRHARWIQVGTLASLGALAAVFVRPAPVAASLFGEENATLAAILGEDIAAVAQAVKTVAGIIQQIEQLSQMIQQGKTLLSAAKGGSMGSLLNVLEGAASSYRTIDRDIKMIGYQLQQVDQQRETVYQDSLSGVPASDFHKHYATWNAQIAESSRIAMRAQTNLDTLQSRNELSKQIASESQGTEGVVGQLQLVVSGIGLLHSDLEALQRSLDTGERVTASMAASSASAAAMSDEYSNRMLDHYTDVGPRPSVPNELP